MPIKKNKLFLCFNDGRRYVSTELFRTSLVEENLRVCFTKSVSALAKNLTFYFSQTRDLVAVRAGGQTFRRLLARTMTCNYHSSLNLLMGVLLSASTSYVCYGFLMYHLSLSNYMPTSGHESSLRMRRLGS